MGFTATDVDFPSANYKSKLGGYEADRDFPAKNATTRIGLHLRFGTVSIRELVRTTIAEKSEVWLSELIWRDFYFTILYHTLI